jgi:hypothetical protein
MEDESLKQLLLLQVVLLKRALKTSILNVAHDPGHRKSDILSQKVRWQRWPQKFKIVCDQKSSCINATSQVLDASSKLS